MNRPGHRGLFLTGSVPTLVGLSIAGGAAIQDFSTALRTVPGLVTLAAYVSFP